MLSDGTDSRGYLYWDNGGYGLVNNTGNWSVRANEGLGLGGTLYGVWEATGGFYSPWVIENLR